MNIAFCYEHVLPARGGCGTYISDLARRLVADGHAVHLYACTWDASALPEGIHYHHLRTPRGPRFLRPWRFGAACLQALEAAEHDVTVGFDKTWGQDVLYPQGGLHAASAEHNLHKYTGRWTRNLARMAKWLDLAHWSYSALERRQYLGADRPFLVVNSAMVARHFQQHYRVVPESLRIVRSAINPDRFGESDRLRQRHERRSECGIAPNATVALFVAMNYRLKGLDPLLYAVSRLPAAPFRLLVVGHPKISAYERLARRLGIEERVCFLGPRRDVREWYFAADFLVHPTFYDPCSLVVLEALGCGLPVITTRFNGASELLNPPNEGYVLNEPHDHGQLAWYMGQLFDPARRAACAQAARRAGSQWTFEQHYRQLLAVFGEAAARKRAA